MLRDKNLIPLSHQHQHALALCVRIDRAVQAGEVDLPAWRAEIDLLFRQEIDFHFRAEEQHLFPAAAQFAELRTLVDELLLQHGELRHFFSAAGSGTLDNASLGQFGKNLSVHIRKEERELFEGIQQRMTVDELSALGTALNEALLPASDACIIPTETTRLKPRR